jgi:hypothetical protein
MDDEKSPEAEKKPELLMPTASPGGAGIPAPANSWAVGPGEPGPGDDWKFPTEPIDGATVENEPANQPADPTETELHSPDR